MKRGVNRRQARDIWRRKIEIAEHDGEQLVDLMPGGPSTISHSPAQPHAARLVYWRVKKNVAPASTPPSAQIRPPQWWIARCTVARPIPLPENSFSVCRR